MKKYIMSIDQGTTSTRAIIFDEEGEPRWSSQKDIEQFFPEPGWVEHDANEIWLKTLQVIASVMIESGLEPEDLDSIGITNQRETTVIWDKETGTPIYHAVVWQSTQSLKFAQSIKSSGHKESVDKTDDIRFILSLQRSNGYLIRSKFSRERAENGDYYLVQIDTSVWKLTALR